MVLFRSCVIPGSNFNPRVTELESFVKCMWGESGSHTVSCILFFFALWSSSSFVPLWVVESLVRGAICSTSTWNTSISLALRLNSHLYN